jgi:hypothetical protein
VFEAGRHYRVTQEFKDYDGDVHPVGEQWIFRGEAFLPYEDGVSWFVSKDGKTEQHIRMQSRAGQQQHILHDLAQYFAAGSLVGPTDVTMLAQYRFAFTDEFRMTANRRHQSLQPWRRIPPEKSGIVSLIFLALGVVSALSGDSMLFIFFAGVAAIVLVMGLLGMSRARRRMQSSPYRNDQVVFSVSEQGVYVVGRHSEMRLAWPLLTKAVRFDDGWLLFQGPYVVNWLPDSAATAADTVAVATRLIKEHVRDYRDA